MAALVIGLGLCVGVGCSSDTVPVVSDSEPIQAEQAPAAGPQAEQGDPMRDAMYSADPSLPPGRKE